MLNFTLINQTLYFINEKREELFVLLNIAEVLETISINC